MCIRDRSVTKDGKVFPGHDCDLVSGIISSFKDADLDLVVTRYTAGWVHENGEKKYFFGAGVKSDYDGEIPEGFEPVSYTHLHGCIIFDSDNYIDDIVDCAQRYGINLEKTKKKYFETIEQVYQ